MKILVAVMNNDFLEACFSLNNGLRVIRIVSIISLLFSLFVLTRMFVSGIAVRMGAMVDGFSLA